MPPAEATLLAACRTLFGEEVRLGPEFLAALQPSGAKLAFRNRVKEHHPDRFAGAPQEVRLQQTERFRAIHQAYTLVSDFLAHRQHGSVRPGVGSAPAHPQPRSGRPRPAPQAGDLPGPPPIPLEFGLFAYYRRKIDYRDLIEALVWQRRQRPAIGIIACQWGWLSEIKVRAILCHRGNAWRFGRKAVELGLLSPSQVEALLCYQRTRQRRIGQYFIERGLLTAGEADRLEHDLGHHNARHADARD